MKTNNMQVKGRGGGGIMKANPQQVIFELKKKVVTALNKLADRDTHQRGVDELERTVEHLAPDKISCFLSCILDTDSEQKSAVRKECIRLMATLARFHEALVGPYLAKMVSSIVKRLKDPDSVVRDACIETMGVLASKMSCYEDHNYGVFVSLVKPLFEAIGDQNKCVQSGAALCLARVIDSSPEAPVAIIQRMLTRTVKLLNNSHFIAKPAVIELNRSIILAGGATAKSVLSSAMTSFQDALKNKDWTTRKAASVALMEIAATGEKFLGPLKASCICSLESCRFDKVKPVRDSVILALQYWKGVPGSDSPEPSETGSSVKESYNGTRESSELFSTTDSKLKDATSNKYVTDLARKEVPVTARKVPARYNDGPRKTKQDNWHIDITVPESSIVSKVDIHNEESEGSCITKTFAEVRNTPEATYEYIPMEVKADCYITDAINENDDIKSTTVSSSSFRASGMVNPAITSKHFAAEETYSEDQPFSTKLKDRTSLDSTVTVSSSQINHDCYAQIANEMASVRKQLSDIDNKQSRLIDQLQAFSKGIMNNFSVLQSKVSSLEYAVEGIAQNVVLHTDISNSNFVKHNQGSTQSPRLSSCTSRTSMDIRNRQSTLSSSKYSMTRENKTHGRSRLNESQGMEKTRSNPLGKTGQQHSREDIWNNIGQGRQTLIQTRTSSDSIQSIRLDYAEVMSGSRKPVTGVSCEDVVESEYIEVLSSGDELALVELLDRTGPVLESMSSQTINEILSILLSYLLERRFMNSILPWLHQVADLSTTNGANYLIPSARKRAQMLSAIQEASGMDFSNLAERRAVTQIAMKLRKLWGKCS
ncbi:PREDICTED: microtubule-associated protein TORTIFOLIA1-like [Camelina sativa]|uniref:Microtubule-associated protein TORTIFOLIA1-like n=1 Tax=Camelina sativa TaxID=90675 RepID=A0ABM0SLQ6_CAMSA|nr:PREDICTED: microtubule-associated protein TORTIFOLIA1-like [Camelina sativa]XP_010413116.1 PREDICTED: microtubule-associated protein TORTIFOLIA1-like [Camelina sativa]